MAALTNAQINAGLEKIPGGRELAVIRDLERMHRDSGSQDKKTGRCVPTVRFHQRLSRDKRGTEAGKEKRLGAFLLFATFASQIQPTEAAAQQEHRSWFGNHLRASLHYDLEAARNIDPADLIDHRKGAGIVPGSQTNVGEDVEEVGGPERGARSQHQGRALKARIVKGQQRACEIKGPRADVERGGSSIGDSAGHADTAARCYHH